MQVFNTGCIIPNLWHPITSIDHQTSLITNNNFSNGYNYIPFTPNVQKPCKLRTWQPTVCLSWKNSNITYECIRLNSCIIKTRARERSERGEWGAYTSLLKFGWLNYYKQPATKSDTNFTQHFSIMFIEYVYLLTIVCACRYMIVFKRR